MCWRALGEYAIDSRGLARERSSSDRSSARSLRPTVTSARHIFGEFVELGGSSERLPRMYEKAARRALEPFAVAPRDGPPPIASSSSLTPSRLRPGCRIACSSASARPRPSAKRLLDTMEALDGARWIDDDNLHLTLRFVGEVERPAANDLAEALGADRLRRASSCAWRAPGAFDRSRRHESYPHAVWARVPLTDPLEGLRQKIERACERAGLGRETRRFTPHITLARTDRATEPVADWLAAPGAISRPGRGRSRTSSCSKATSGTPGRLRGGGALRLARIGRAA